MLTSAGFTSLAILALPNNTRITLLRKVLEGLRDKGVVQGYAAAAVLCLGIGPFTAVMVPTNFEMIRMNEERAGTRSERSEKEGKKKQGRGDKDVALSSIGGEGQASEWTDLSGPQGKTGEETSKEDDEKVGELLERFGTMNMVRALLIGGGGVVGLLTALA
ncbi:MAG: hypothetical protein Q9200_006956 [Gallowayella weberi]